MPKKKSDKEAKPKSEAIKKPSAKKAGKAAATKPAPAPSESKAPTAPKSKPKQAAKPAKTPEIVITNDDIALRAYYIAERRHKLGWPGDSTGDWVEAERQLRAEAKKKKA